VNSVGGLLSKLIDRVPIDGSHASIEGLEIEALEGRGRRHRITHVRVTRTDTDTAVEATQTAEAAGSGTQDRSETKEEDGDGISHGLPRGLPRGFRLLRGTTEHRQVDADECAGGGEGRDHLGEAADDAAHDPGDRPP